MSGTNFQQWEEVSLKVMNSSKCSNSKMQYYYHGFLVKTKLVPKDFPFPVFFCISMIMQVHFMPTKISLSEHWCLGMMGGRHRLWALSNRVHLTCALIWTYSSDLGGEIYCSGFGWHGAYVPWFLGSEDWFASWSCWHVIWCCFNNSLQRTKIQRWLVRLIGCSWSQSR